MLFPIMVTAIIVCWMVALLMRMHSLNGWPMREGKS